MFGRIFLAAMLVVFTWSTAAMSGAWPRPKGDVFLAFSARQDVSGARAAPMVSVFGEYGLTDRLTVGGKALYDPVLNGFTEYHATARWHFPQAAQPWRKAVSLTLSHSQWGQRVKPVFHLGRGLDFDVGSGWVDIEFFTSFPIKGRGAEYGSYATLGIKPNDQFMAMIGGDVLVSDTDFSVKVIPAIAWEYQPGRHVNMQFSKGLGRGTVDEVELGVWLAF